MSTSGAELFLKSLDRINDSSFKALEQNDKKAKGVLIGSIIYLPLIQIALVLDKVFIL